MPTFLTISGTPVEILKTGATQRTGERVGDSGRTISGVLRSIIVRTLRSWEVQTGPMVPLQEANLRALVENDALVFVSGDITGGASVLCMIEMGETTYESDGTTDGFFRFAKLSIRESGAIP